MNRQLPACSSVYNPSAAGPCEKQTSVVQLPYESFRYQRIFFRFEGDCRILQVRMIDSAHDYILFRISLQLYYTIQNRNSAAFFGFSVKKFILSCKSDTVRI